MKKLLFGAAVGLTVIGVACQPPGDKAFKKAVKTRQQALATTTTLPDNAWMRQGQTPYPGTDAYVVVKWMTVAPEAWMPDGPCVATPEYVMMTNEDGGPVRRQAGEPWPPAVHAWYDDGHEATFRCTFSSTGTGSPVRSTPTSAPKVTTTRACQEDEPCWDCRTMGNRVCGAKAGAPETTTTTARRVAPHPLP